MKLKTILEKSTQILASPLPGRSAQQWMAPSFRENDQQLPDKVQESSVLLLLYEQKETVYIALTKRSRKIAHHRGQISFPGGKVDVADKNFTATALRENKEELGIPETQVKIIGKLTELYIPSTNFRIHPFVGYLLKNLSFQPNRDEVDELISFPVTLLSDKNAQKEKEWQHKGQTYLKPYYEYKSYVIWGATAMILSEFSSCLRRI